MKKELVGILILGSLNLIASENLVKGKVNKYDLDNKRKYCSHALKKAEIEAIEACQKDGMEYAEDFFKTYSCRGVMLSAAMDIKYTEVELEFDCE